MSDFEKFSAALEYAESDGIVRWRLTHSRRSGLPVGNLHTCRGKTYLRMKFQGRQYLVHRVAWLLHTGKWPEGEIDHIDGDSLNNRITNLRDVSRGENQRNQGLHKKNKSGFPGVSFHASTGRWAVHIWANGRRLFIGRFKEKADAIEARIKANREHGYQALTYSRCPDLQPLP